MNKIIAILIFGMISCTPILEQPTQPIQNPILYRDSYIIIDSVIGKDITVADPLTGGTKTARNVMVYADSCKPNSGITFTCTFPDSTYQFIPQQNTQISSFNVSFFYSLKNLSTQYNFHIQLEEPSGSTELPITWR
jgi:hypothetical protein